MCLFHVPLSLYLSCAAIYAHFVSYLYINIPHCITVTAQYMSQTLGPKIMVLFCEHQKMRSSHPSILLPWKADYHCYYSMSSLRSVAWLTLPLSLTNQIFHIRALCQNDLCEFCAKHCWHLDHTVKTQVSLDNYLLTNVKLEHCGCILLRSDALKGLGPCYRWPHNHLTSDSTLLLFS